jgi:hypothetical protein
LLDVESTRSLFEYGFDRGVYSNFGKEGTACSLYIASRYWIFSFHVIVT